MRSVVLAALTDEALQQVASTVKSESNVTAKPLPEADTAFEAALIISANAFGTLKERLLDPAQQQLAAAWQDGLESQRRRFAATVR